jgi:hypothetical protein
VLLPGRVFVLTCSAFQPPTANRLHTIPPQNPPIRQSCQLNELASILGLNNVASYLFHNVFRLTRFFLRVIAKISVSSDSFFLLTALPSILGLNHIAGYLSAFNFLTRFNFLTCFNLLTRFP